ncbi:MAG: hypothetical protein Q7R43_01110 [Candidatus Daviesbacteria bacterium]|nr:hypothetical protein [Candidatus Daviesbacteria bacterium]
MSKLEDGENTFDKGDGSIINNIPRLNMKQYVNDISVLVKK